MYCSCNDLTVVLTSTDQTNIWLYLITLESNISGGGDFVYICGDITFEIEKLKGLSPLICIVIVITSLQSLSHLKSNVCLYQVNFEFVLLWHFS